VYRLDRGEADAARTDLAQALRLATDPLWRGQIEAALNTPGG
jgi:hypothetical protein